MIEIPLLLKSKKLASLDGLRGVSIAFVIFSHFIYVTAFNEQTNFGMVGVDIFFVISGFLITTLLLKEQVLNGRISLRKFYIRRALRILPVVVLFLTVLLILNQLFQLKIGARSFLASILFIRNLPVPNCNDWQTAHFWSLGVEEQFYLIFPFLIARMKLKNYRNFIVFLICLIPIVNYVYYNEVGIFVSNRIVHNITGVFANLLGKGTALILVGSLLSVLMFGQSKWLSFVSRSNPRILSLFIFVLAIFVRIPSSILFIQYFSEEVFAFLIGIVIILNLKGDNYLAKFLNLKWISFIGVLSYSLYIWQQIFTHEQPWSHSFPGSGSVLFNLPLLILVGFISYHFYEKKFLLLKSRFSNA